MNKHCVIFYLNDLSGASMMHGTLKSFVFPMIKYAQLGEIL